MLQEASSRGLPQLPESLSEAGSSPHTDNSSLLAAALASDAEADEADAGLASGAEDAGPAAPGQPDEGSLSSPQALPLEAVPPDPLPDEGTASPAPSPFDQQPAPQGGERAVTPAGLEPAEKTEAGEQQAVELQPGAQDSSTLQAMAGPAGQAPHSVHAAIGFSEASNMAVRCLQRHLIALVPRVASVSWSA